MVVTGEGAPLALAPPLSLELGCDDGCSDTSSVGRAGLVRVGCRCWLFPGQGGSLALGNRETRALPVLWLQRTKELHCPGQWALGLAASSAESKHAWFSTFVEVTLPALPWEMACKFKE